MSGKAVIGSRSRDMPTVFRHGAFRFFFYSNEGTPREPPHIHVRRQNAEAKIWVGIEVTVAASYGFDARTLSEIVAIVSARKVEIEQAWHDHFTD